MSRHVVTEADLHAYVDGVLPLARAAEVEAIVGRIHWPCILPVYCINDQ